MGGLVAGYASTDYKSCKLYCALNPLAEHSKVGL